MFLDRIRLKIGAVAGLALIATACVKDDVSRLSGDNDDRVRLTLYTNVPEYETPSRTTADETGIVAPMVLVFTGTNGTATFSEAAQAETVGTQTSVTLHKTDDPSILLLLANTPDGKYRYGTAEKQLTVDNLTNDLENKTLADVENILLAPLFQSPMSTAPFLSERLPMSGYVSVTGINSSTTLGTTTNPLMLTRSVAKVSVQTAAPIPGFQLIGAGLHAAPANGILYSWSGTVPTNTGNTLNYMTASQDILAAAVSQADGTYSTAENPLYLYEADKDLGTALIIKANYGGSPYFYKLAFYYDDDYQPINRNKNYVFTLLQGGPGYLTAEDAYNGPPSNIDYEITVTDAYAHDMVSNGQYYLGLTNSAVQVYGFQTELTDAFTITTDASSSDVQTATISYSLGLSGPTTINLGMPGTLTNQPVTVTMGSLIFLGTATVRVGSLSLDVSFTRSGYLDYSGYRELPGTYVAHEIENPGTGNWLYASPDGSTRSADLMTRTSAGKLYLMADPNVVPSDGERRTGASMFAVRKNADGSQSRTKIFVNQDVLETGDIETEHRSGGRFYVGAFWRYNQTGERLITVPYLSGATSGEWTATVIVGADWIKLDINPTEDPGITRVVTTEDPADMNQPANDARYQVKGNAVSVGGVCETDNPIYFRVGLRSGLTHVEAPPRYGLILLDYADKQARALIYIRQGEAADYLMRPEDPDMEGILTAGSDGIYRPKANKWQPYNLTAAEFALGTYGGTDVQDHPQLALRGGTQTDYPTQAGAFFQYLAVVNGGIDYTRRAYHPSDPADGFTNWYHPNSNLKTPWTTLRTTNETCPDGYRRPTHITISEPLSYSLTVEDYIQSEVVTSLHYQLADRNNMLEGYYADGFFDRYAIVNATYTYSKVSSGYKVAYKGKLVYNPNTNASLFFPFSGYRESYVSSSYGRHTQVGGRTYFWTSAVSTAASAAHNYYFTTGSVTGGINGTNNMFSAYSIRCVAERDDDD